MEKVSSVEKAYKRFMIFVWITLLLVVIVNFVAQPKYLPFWPFTANDVLRHLFYLFVVALFIERAVEVIIAVWRSPGEQQLLGYIKIFKQPAENKPEKQIAKIAAVAEKQGRTIPRTLAEADLEHSNYSADTGRRAIPVTFVIGFLISAVGIRALQPLIDPAFFHKTLSTTQQTLFSLMDVLVTGALLGGGSDGIHQIMDLIINTAKKRKEEAKKAP